MPPLTEERRRDLVKLVKKEAEEARVSLRNIRRDAIAHLKKQKEEKHISEDMEKNQEEATQKLVEKYSAEIDTLLKNKESEIMEV
jgi:ribosome recycling factor